MFCSGPEDCNMLYFPYAWGRERGYPNRCVSDKKFVAAAKQPQTTHRPLTTVSQRRTEWQRALPASLFLCPQAEGAPPVWHGKSSRAMGKMSVLAWTLMPSSSCALWSPGGQELDYFSLNLLGRKPSVAPTALRCSRRCARMPWHGGRSGHVAMWPSWALPRSRQSKGPKSSSSLRALSLLPLARRPDNAVPQTPPLPPRKGKK